MFGSPDVGDWVRLKKRTAVTFTDILTGDGLPEGSLGVVVARFGSSLQVDVDAGWGSSRATVKSWDVRVVRRKGGQEAFAKRTHYLTVVRVSLALFLAWPVISYIALYFWEHQTFDGLTIHLSIGLIEGAFEQVNQLIADPVRGLLLLGLFALFSRIAFGPSSRRR